MKNMEQEKLIIGRMRWLINLRWIASAGVIITVYLAHNIFNIPLHVQPLYSIAAILLAYNALLYVFIPMCTQKSTHIHQLVNVLANIQIVFDLTCLTALIHFSGGVENPFIFYFIFHIIIASILLTRRAAFLQATYAAVLFLFIVFLEHAEILSHYCLNGVLPFCLNSSIIYIGGISFAFISTLYIAVYMATSISQKLYERERSLELTNILLNEKDQIKSKYVLRVTHNIKEDLAAIQSCIEPVTGGLLGTLNEGQGNLLQRAKARSNKLIVYVNALLTITKLKLTKELKMEIFDFPEIVQEISDRINAGLQRKHITFTSHVGTDITTIKGVRVYIHETLLNLLRNAIKYTPDNGEIDLAVKKEEGNLISIVIKDTGIGIPESDLPHIFEEFYRAQNARDEERQGTGLGLSMAKQIIEMHNGRIWIESKEGKGSSVFITLPCSS